MVTSLCERRGRQQPPPPPPPRQPRVRPLGVAYEGVIVTGHFEDHFIVDEGGDSWMPITYIAGPGFRVLMNCADGSDVPEAANDKD